MKNTMKPLVWFLLCFTGIWANGPAPQAPSSIINLNILNTGSAFFGESVLGRLGMMVSKELRGLKVGDRLRLLRERIGSHRKSMLLGGVFVGYGFLQYKIIILNHNLSQAPQWSCWRHDCTLEQLRQIDRTKLGNELLKEIQLVYMDFEDPTGFVQPLTRFIQDSETELDMLKRYQSWYGVTRRLCVASLCFFKKEIADSIDQRVQRLLFVRHMFLTWLADYKVDMQNNVKKR